MNIGIISETKESVKVWNAFRFAVTARMQDQGVKFFLMEESPECEALTHQKSNVDAQSDKSEATGGEILTGDTCLKSHQLEDSAYCFVSTRADSLEMEFWPGMTVTF